VDSNLNLPRLEHGPPQYQVGIALAARRLAPATLFFPCAATRCASLATEMGQAKFAPHKDSHGVKTTRKLPVASSRESAAAITTSGLSQISRACRALKQDACSTSSTTFRPTWDRRIGPGASRPLRITTRRRDQTAAFAATLSAPASADTRRAWRCSCSRRAESPHSRDEPTNVTRRRNRSTALAGCNRQYEKYVFVQPRIDFLLLEGRCYAR